jgi:hypothetical protein
MMMTPMQKMAAPLALALCDTLAPRVGLWLTCRLTGDRSPPSEPAAVVGGSKAVSTVIELAACGSIKPGYGLRGAARRGHLAELLVDVLVGL